MYLDLVVLEEVFMDFILLYTTAKVLNIKINKLRTISASTIGAFSTILIILNLPYIYINLSKVAIALVMLKITFKKQSLKRFTKIYTMFLVVSFIFAGIELMIIHIIKPDKLIMINGIIIGGNYIGEIMIPSAIISYLVIMFAKKTVKIKYLYRRKDLVCNLEIFFYGEKVRAKALMDTGNLLKDPITNIPVVIVEKEKVKNLVGYNNWENNINERGGDRLNSFRLIPFKTVGSEVGIIPAYKVQKIKLEYQEEVYIVNDVFIGIYNNALSKNGKYSALVGLQILERSTVNDKFNRNIEIKGKHSLC